MSAIPRLVVSAPSSGHGKTAMAVGLLAAFSARGLHGYGFKIGPDHVDAGYLGLAAGRPARNLDPQLVGAERIGPLFNHGAAGGDIAVIEGTMGLFDGLAGRTDTESTAQIAGLLRAPVVLVVDVGAMGQSVAALVHGFRSYDELLWLGGVILNRVGSGRHEQVLREAMADIGVPVLGALRRRRLSEAAAGLPSRAHGVVPVVHRTTEAVRAVRQLGEVVADGVEIDRVLAMARSAPPLVAEAWDPLHAVVGVATTGEVFSGPALGVARPLIAVTLGYGYAETAELLTAAGAEVTGFDPLRDETLPDNVAGLVLGGALPEAYLDELSANERLRHRVAALARAGAPIVAEGAGMVWLCREFDGRPMCGVLDAAGTNTDFFVVGYREATAHAASCLLPAGAQVTGHKLHRTQVAPRAGSSPAWSWAGGQPEGYVERAVHASYLCLNWAGYPEIATRFVKATRTGAGAGSEWMPVHREGDREAVPAQTAPLDDAPAPATAGEAA
jgi:cobyrinic acid a,c-diamide synthase